MVSCGCFNDTIDEFIKKVNDTHKDNETYRKQYLGAIEYIKTIAPEFGQEVRENND